MFDLSPDKLIVVLTVAMVVLGPDKLPAAARSLAHGLARARRLASTLSEPITSTLAEPVRAGLAEPRKALDDAVADLRSAIASHPLPDGTIQPSPDPSLN